MLELEPNRRFFGHCDIEIGNMTPKNNRAPFLYHYKLMHNFVAIGEFELVTARKRSILVKIVDFFPV